MKRKNSLRNNPRDVVLPLNPDAEDSAGLLANERAATLEARAAESRLQKRLSKAEADNQRIREELQRARSRSQKAPVQSSPQAAQDKARAEKDLERARVVHVRESEQAKAKIDELRSALAMARDAISRSSDGSERNHLKKILVGLAATLVIGAGVLGTTKYLQRGGGASVAAAGPANVGRAPVGDGRSIEEPEAGEASTDSSAGSKPQSDFSEGISQLNQALNRFPTIDPQVIIRAVNKKASASGAVPCALAWNNGQPSVQFGSPPGGNYSLAGALSRCATAVDQLRPIELPSKANAGGR